MSFRSLMSTRSSDDETWCDSKLSLAGNSLPVALGARLFSTPRKRVVPFPVYKKRKKVTLMFPHCLLTCLSRSLTLEPFFLKPFFVPFPPKISARIFHSGPEGWKYPVWVRDPGVFPAS